MVPEPETVASSCLLLSVSSQASLEAYERLKEDIASIQQSETELQNLVDTAQDHYQ